MISILFKLVTDGIEFPWCSWRVIVLLVLGAVGWTSFHVQQHFATNLMVPEHLFSNQTSAAAYTLTFLTSVVAQNTIYFISIHLQGIIGTTVLRAGVYLLPTALKILVAAAVTGIILSNTGVYKTLDHVLVEGQSSLY